MRDLIVGKMSTEDMRRLSTHGSYIRWSLLFSPRQLNKDGSNVYVAKQSYRESPEWLGEICMQGSYCEKPLVNVALLCSPQLLKQISSYVVPVLLHLWLKLLSSLRKVYKAVPLYVRDCVPTHCWDSTEVVNSA